MEHYENSILLRGSLRNLPEFSHENHGKKFYRFILEVPRLSGTVDSLPVMAELGVLETLDLTDDTGRHLLIFVFARSILAEDGPGINEVCIRGTVCRSPTLRTTPLGRQICDVMLAVPRSFRRADYLPCILWGRTAQQAARCDVRDDLYIFGRLQSRLYTKHTETGTFHRTAYEISALTARCGEDAAI